MLTIQDKWNEYKQILPADACPVQIKETKLAFFAGAAAMHFTMVHEIPNASENEDAQVMMLDTIQQELFNYIQTEMEV